MCSLSILTVAIRAEIYLLVYGIYIEDGSDIYFLYRIWFVINTSNQSKDNFLIGQVPQLPGKGQWDRDAAILTS